MSIDTDVALAFEMLKKHSLVLITAESLTAGLIASKFAEIPGATEVLWGGYVVYTPSAKNVELGVSELLISKFGIVSEEVASAMAYGALLNSRVQSNAIALAVTGYAGPSGGTLEKPVGTVCVGLAGRLLNNSVFTNANTFCFSGSRNEIRDQTVKMSVKMLVDTIENI